MSMIGEMITSGDGGEGRWRVGGRKELYAMWQHCGNLQYDMAMKEERKVGVWM